MYFVLLTTGLCLAYVALFFLFPYFFERTPRPFTRRAVWSVFTIALCSALAFSVSALIPDRAWGNRVLHVFGGGFLVFLVCVLAVRDSGLRLGRSRFFISSLLIVLALGTANELLEFFLQEYFQFDFARSVDDTWLDLLSNTIGGLIASACFLPFMKGSGKAFVHERSLRTSGKGNFR